MDPNVVLLVSGLLMPAGTQLTLPTLPRSKTHKGSLTPGFAMTHHFRIIETMAFPPPFQKGLIFLVQFCIPESTKRNLGYHTGSLEPVSCPGPHLAPLSHFTTHRPPPTRHLFKFLFIYLAFRRLYSLSPLGCKLKQFHFHSFSV